MIRYRPEIDGMRAVAVLSVLIFHINEFWLPGGFQGVDIFFVISGYLITKIIKNDIEHDRFSFKQFYTRRIKRILPAFYSVCFFTTLLVYLLFLPIETVEYIFSLLSSIAFVSNFYFYSETANYFFQSDANPLLHIWSLSIEEQYYFVFPLIIFYFRKKPAVLLSILFLTSIGISQYLVSSGKSQLAFYVTPFRISPILAGSLFTFLEKPFHERFKNHISLLPAMGLTVILLTLIFSDYDNFPGFKLLLPTIGTLSLIASPSNSIIIKFLSHNTLVLIGKLSYSIYLFHWPLLSIAQHYEFSSASKCLIALFSVFFAYLNNKFVENKFRYINFDYEKTLLYFLLCPLIMFGLISLSSIYSDGWKYRYDMKDTYKEKYKKFFFSNNFHDHPNQNNYLVNHGPNYPTFALIGDSHAGHFYEFLGNLAKVKKVNLVVLTVGNCAPGVDETIKYAGIYRKRCQKIYDILFNIMSKLNGVIFAGYYSDKIKLEGYEESISGLIQKIRKLDKKVILLSQVPEYKNHSNIYKYGLAIRYGMTLPKFKLDNKFVQGNKYIKRIAGKQQATFVNLTYYFPLLSDYSPYLETFEKIYSDYNHLNQLGSYLLFKKYIDSKEIQKSEIFNL